MSPKAEVRIELTMSVLQTNAFDRLATQPFGSLDGSCTRFSVLERRSDLSSRPRGYTGVTRLELATYRSTGDRSNHLSYTPMFGICAYFLGF
jgi:hypothetical protein